VKTILIVIRSEGDFERAISIGITAKNKYNTEFIFTGDFSPFFEDGIHNTFQKKLCIKNKFEIKDFSDYSFIGRLLKKLSGNKRLSFNDVRKNPANFIKYFFFTIFSKFIKRREYSILNKIFSSVQPDFVLTDQSNTDKEYLPEKIRQKAIEKGIKVYIYTHGAAGGLHSEFSNPVFKEYKNCTVFACSTNETDPNFTNRIILGDISSSYPYVHYLNEQSFDEIEFGSDKKYRIAFLIGGVMQAFTSTNGWSIQEEIIINLSEREDVAMILKLHPREAKFMDLRMLNKFKNLKIVNNETDRSRITKWANIFVCNDHTSVIFEPMILGKKVVAIEGIHVPKYKNHHSPLKNSSLKFITNASEFSLENIPNANPIDDVTNQIAWGGNGNIDLTELMLKKLKS